MFRQKIDGWQAAALPVSEQAYREAAERLDRIAKPLDSLGLFEEQLKRIAAIQKSAGIKLTPARLTVFCGDHGIIEEGVSQSDSSISRLVAESMARGGSSVCRMAAREGVDVHIVDVGLKEVCMHPAVICDNVRRGSRNFLHEAAMSEEETLMALDAGIRQAREAKEGGIRILLTGEMGIGNTSSSSALAAALLGQDVKAVTGRGAGLDDAGLKRKIEVIERALDRHSFTGKTEGKEEVFRLLSCVGGYELAALSGLCIGGALYGIPVILDGLITAAAALTAVRMVPACTPCLLASHQGKELAMEALLKELKLEAPIRAGLALGEGTGAVMGYSLLRDALAVYEEAAPFSELDMKAYKRLC
ncbi:MAG: nicotinate-nucleotide--dimethylbenzimidazole phosphoribosyltransferase [Lachnospiraceae bacterium]|nr:nicotinate-nucleotide--dimethylbenzimidazole phosphoribosyltransferase [Lachnospiraceae bacterium]